MENFDLNSRVADRNSQKPIYILVVEGSGPKDEICIHVTSHTLLPNFVDVHGSLLDKDNVTALRSKPSKNETADMHWLVPNSKVKRFEDVAYQAKKTK